MKKLFLLFFVSGSAFAADDAAVLKCRTIADINSRVACYDAMPVVVPGSPAAVAAARAEREKSFGAVTVVKAPAEEVKEVDSTIVGKFEGWRPGSRITLANGQVWRVVNGEGYLGADSPKVKVKQGLSRAFFMTFEGINDFATVVRVK